MENKYYFLIEFPPLLDLQTNIQKIRFKSGSEITLSFISCLPACSGAPRYVHVDQNDYQGT